MIHPIPSQSLPHFHLVEWQQPNLPIIRILICLGLIMQKMWKSGVHVTLEKLSTLKASNLGLEWSYAPDLFDTRNSDRDLSIALQPRPLLHPPPKIKNLKIFIYICKANRQWMAGIHFSKLQFNKALKAWRELLQVSVPQTTTNNFDRCCEEPRTPSQLEPNVKDTRCIC